ncbi:ABC transporter ATP-binding protein/permease [Methylobacillus gramineus]|uniref:ATP-binding cassette domain-containing protein n=1 Tax=Methylobacillus gramineus TaxID=755169 RepID=UPI001CFFD901|nr:ABC transporter ATP-binding protein [Methylobacillus gramineus]MCB5186252.1 ABC transporter ATP-binding protein/permease [Methylobacillus gramineus]
MNNNAGHKMPPRQRLINLLSLERKDILLVILLMGAVGFINLAIPISVQALINTVTMGSLMKPLLIISFMLFIFLFLAGLFYVLEIFIVELIQRRIFCRIATEAASKTQGARYDVADDLQELVNRFFEVTSVQKSVATLLTIGVATILQGVVGSIILVFYSVYFAVVVALVMLIILVIVYVIGRKASLTAIAESHAKFELAAWLETIARNLNTFKFSSGVSLAQERTDQLAAEYLKKRSAHFRILIKQYLGGVLIYALGGTAMLALGGTLVIQGQINLGQFVAAELIIFAVLASFLRFIGQLEYYYDLLASLDKIGYIQDLPQEKIPTREIEVQRPIKLSAVNLGYDYLRHTASQSGISFTLQPGSSLAVLGVAGSGKSSLASLLTGLKQPVKGHVEFNDIAIDQFNLNQLRKHIGCVGKLEVIEGDIIDNVLIGRDDITLGQVTQLLAKMGLMSSINRLPQGLNTPLSVNGAPFSTTQINLLMLARGIIGQPGLLIVDGLLDYLDDADLQRALPLLLDLPACSVVIMTRHAAIAQHFENILTLELLDHVA